MGNQHSEKKQDDNDSPDEKSQSCCKPPKKKSKDKSNKRTSSKSDDNDFDANEVYPFDSKCKEESEIVEPVDLEPFEIIETDDLSFVAGAGTSEVILSGSDGKFRISREIILEEPNEDSTTGHENKKADEKAQTKCETEDDNSDKEIFIEAGHKSQIAASPTSKELSNEAKPLESKSLNTCNQTEKIAMKNEKESIMTKDDGETVHLDSGFTKSEKINSRMIVLSQDMFTKKAGTETNKNIVDAAEDNESKANLPAKQEVNVSENDAIEPVNVDSEAEHNPTTIKCDSIQTKDSDSTAVYENINTKGVEDIIAKQAPLQTTVPVKYILTQEMFTKESQIIESQAPNSECHYESTKDIIDIPLTKTVTSSTDFNAGSDNQSYKTDKDSASAKLKLKAFANIPKRDNDIVNISNPTYGYDADDSIIRGSQEENIYETVEPIIKCDLQNKTKQDIYSSVSKSIKTNNAPGGTARVSKVDNARDDMTDEKRIETGVSISVIGSPAESESSSQTTSRDESQCSKKISRDVNELLTSKANDDNPELLDPSDLYATIGEPTQSSRPESNRQIHIGVGDSVSKNEKQQALSKTESLEIPPSESTATSSREATVPPPSPASMNILTEEDEDAEDETEHTQFNEITEFGDIVCKRLSRLLEDVSFQDETATTSVDQDSIIYFSPKEFIDTSTGRYEMQEIENFNENQDTISDTTETELAGSNRGQREKNEECLPSDQTDISSQKVDMDKLGLRRNDSADTLKRISGDSSKYDLSQANGSSDDGLPDFFDPENRHGSSRKKDVVNSDGDKLRLSLQDFDDTLVQTTPNTSFVDDLTDVTPTVDISREFTALPELAKTDDNSVVQYEHNDQRRSITGTESDLDMSEQRTDMSTDSMYADDEAEETMDILFTKTYTEPLEGAEVFLSCTVVNSAYKEESKKKEVWLSSDEALEYFEANPAEVMSTAFMKAKKEMKDIQLCLQNLRKQMDNFQGNLDDISLPDLPMSDSLSPDFHNIRRKAVTD